MRCLGFYRVYVRTTKQQCGNKEVFAIGSESFDTGGTKVGKEKEELSLGLLHHVCHDGMPDNVWGMHACAL